MVSALNQNEQQAASLNNVIDASGSPREVIGTVITNSDGESALEFKEQEFRDGSERWPDLLIAIFTPFTSNLYGQTPPPIEQRLLLFSFSTKSKGSESS